MSNPEEGPRMMLNGYDYDHASRLERKAELAAWVEELAKKGAADRFKGHVEEYLKEDKDKKKPSSKFIESHHPRGEDGKFVKKGSLTRGIEKARAGDEAARKTKATNDWKAAVKKAEADLKKFKKDTSNGYYPSDKRRIREKEAALRKLKAAKPK